MRCLAPARFAWSRSGPGPSGGAAFAFSRLGLAARLGVPPVAIETGPRRLRAKRDGSIAAGTCWPERVHDCRFCPVRPQCRPAHGRRSKWGRRDQVSWERSRPTCSDIGQAQPLFMQLRSEAPPILTCPTDSTVHTLDFRNAAKPFCPVVAFPVLALARKRSPWGISHKLSGRGVSRPALP